MTSPYSYTVTEQLKKKVNWGDGEINQCYLFIFSNDVY